MASLASVTELSLHSVIIDYAFLDMIKSKLPFLEILNLKTRGWTVERLDFTSSSLKRMTFLNRVSENIRSVDIQVYAPKLHQLSYNGKTIPSLLFPSSYVPEYINLELDLWDPVDHSFYLRMRELLDISSKFDIKIVCYKKEVNNDVDDDGEIRFPIPSTNVQQLTCITKSHKEPKMLFKLLTICHPKYLTIYCGTSIKGSKNWFRDFFEHVKVGIMVKKTCNLKDIEFKNPVNNGKWEVLTDSCITMFLDASDEWDEWECELELKPNWQY
ncbi:uncharacterized protein [Rutidosis leptorrhynchoides]|uniref:uncharacterized protein n=1 Tax=Rutidosis leptorrhynchoides TaxID=125765 RepID=UPI003A996665